MKTPVRTLILTLFCAVSIACTQASQPPQGVSEGVPPATGPQASAATPIGPVEPTPAEQLSARACAPLLDALAACAAQSRCDPDMAMFLPGAARSSLIAAESLPGFSEEAFDRYCVQACQARAAEVEEAAFARDVCAIAAPTSSTTPSAPAPVGVSVKGFVLEGKLQIGVEGVPVAALKQALGAPEQDAVTPFECGSAFEAGDIRQLSYPGLVLESDGTTAVVRSMLLAQGHHLMLSDGEPIGAIDEATFQRLFGDRVERVDDGYRMGAGPGDDWETAYDFHFEDGRLARVDYWIGC